jgi:hypothetical protein
MKKMIKILSMCLLAILFATQTYAQDIKKIEKVYLIIQTKLKQEKAILDSLKNILDLKAKKIDYEKNKNNPDETLIVKLMSGSANLSNEIDIQQNKIKADQKNSEEYREDLNRLYSEKIDSLQELDKSKEYSGNKNNLKKEILAYTEKKLLVAPKIALLSFHPDKILEIDLNRINDPSEKKNYEDYLQNALAEVNTHLKNLNESITEADKILTLQKKTNKFIEESEFDFGISPQNNISQSNLTRTNAFNESGPSYVKSSNAVYERNVIEYSLLLNQLNFKPLNSKLKWMVSVNGKSSVRSLSDYNDLQKEVRKRLEEYKLILTNKLNTGK